jgi:hypothetical protein
MHLMFSAILILFWHHSPLVLQKSSVKEIFYKLKRKFLMSYTKIKLSYHDFQLTTKDTAKAYIKEETEQL